MPDNSRRLTVILRQNEVRFADVAYERMQPFLSSFLTATSDKIGYSEDFYCSAIGYDAELAKSSSFCRFFQDREKNNPAHSATILKGTVGIGKTSFLEWWMSQRREFCTRIDINSEGLVLSKADGDISVPIYEEMCKELVLHFLGNSEFHRRFSEKVNALQTRARGLDDHSWEVGFLNQSEEFKRKYPYYTAKYLLVCLASTASDMFNRPLWLLVDNVDLESPDTQYQFIRATHSIYAHMIEISRSLSWKVLFHVVLTARPETSVHWQFFCRQFQDIRYPTPEIVSIALTKIENAFALVSKEHQLSTQIWIGSQAINNTQELCSYIIGSIRRCVNKDSWPFHPVPNEWHLALVGSNVRRFLKAWVHFLLSNNFVKIWADTEEKAKSPYLYLRMLLRGQYNEYPGNELIDGSGESPTSPLFFNLFGWPKRPGISDETYFRSFFNYIRLLQYLLAQDRPVCLNEIKKDLGFVFEESDLMETIKELLWCRLFDEVNTGARDVGGEGKRESMTLSENCIFKHNASTTLYLDSLIKEYEYLSAMAVVTPQFNSTELESIGKLHGNAKYALATYNMLRSCKEILVMNIEDLSRSGSIKRFKSTFVSQKHNSRPLLSAIDACIKAIEGKMQYDRDMNQYKVKFEQLRAELRSYVETTLGDIYGR